MKCYLEIKLGEIGVVTTKEHNIQGKLKSQGTQFMCVGHSINVSSNVSWMLHLETHGIFHSTDVIWL
jgi:hypothetical protein